MLLVYVRLLELRTDNKMKSPNLGGSVGFGLLSPTFSYSEDIGS